MSKRKFTPEQRKVIQDFLEQNSKAIIEAELQTYKDMLVSTHSPRTYLFTPYTIGIVEIQIDGSMSMPDLFRYIIGKFNEDEYTKIYNEAQYDYNQHGSKIMAILSFLPSTAIKIHKNKIHELPEDLQIKLNNYTLSIADIKDDERYCEKYAHLIEDVINVHYVSFYCCKGYIHRVVQHNDEILDLPLISEFDYNGGDSRIEKTRGSLLELKDLIEVE